MLKTNPMLLLAAVLLIISQACAPPALATPDPNTINTAIAQTMAAAATQTAEPGIPVTGQESPTLVVSPAPELPSATPSATLSPTPVFTLVPPFTATPVTPEIRVTTATNCRVGPGIAYARVGGLQVGQVAEVVGRNETGNYWIIREPNRNVTCWLWGEYATVTGNTSVLPVYTPPPTPTPLPTATPSPSFGASYDGLESCAGTGWWVDIKLDNTGGVSFQSIAMTVRDTTTNTVLALFADSFTNRNGCNEIDTRESMPAGVTRIVSSPAFAYDPGGRALRATITLCSNPGQNGLCVTRAINFTP